MIDLNNIRGVIFDLDGTLVESQLDFAAIKAQIDCPPDHDILSFVASLELKHRKAAERVILEHEIADAESAIWLSGAQAFVESLYQDKIPMAIVTRNCQRATRIKVDNNQIPIELVLTREDAAPKPDPEALLKVATLWDIDARELLYVGDYIYDEQAASNAGMQFCYSPFGVI